LPAEDVLAVMEVDKTKLISSGFFHTSNWPVWLLPTWNPHPIQKVPHLLQYGNILESIGS